jgi:hypothetical protein
MDTTTLMYFHEIRAVTRENHEKSTRRVGSLEGF